MPSSTFYRNVRAVLTKKQWSVISKQVRSEAYDICQICHDHADDTHEIWFYDDHTVTRKLVGLRALCKSCHGVKHFGFSRIQGRGEQALQHFMKINELTRQEAEIAITKSFEVWQKRSQKQWKLDISILKDYGIDITKIKERK